MSRGSWTSRARAPVAEPLILERVAPRTNEHGYVAELEPDRVGDLETVCQLTPRDSCIAYGRSDKTTAPSAPATASRSACAACSTGRTDAIGTVTVPRARSSASADSCRPSGRT